MAPSGCDSTSNGDTISEAHIIGKYTTHDVLVFIAILSTSIALLLSFGQIVFHATHYHIPEQQRRINRLLFMIPVYAVSNLLSAIYYNESIYFELVGNAYAAIGLASFFNLLYAYVTEGAQDPKQYFRRLKLKHWQWPLSLLRIKAPRNGLRWFNICYCGVFQYNFVLLVNCIAGSIANVFHKYCPASLSPAHAYIWVLIANAISATISSYCLTQFHRQVRHDLDKHRADFQFLCIQIVLYLSTYQKLLITLLLRRNWIHVTSYIQGVDIRIAVPATSLCVEMVLVSLLHLYAYPLRPYRVWHRPRALANYVVNTTHTRTYTGIGLAALALAEMLNPWDLVTGIARAFKYAVYDLRRRHHDIGYANQHARAWKIGDARSTWERRASLFPPAETVGPDAANQNLNVAPGNVKAAKRKRRGDEGNKDLVSEMEKEKEIEVEKMKPTMFMSEAGSIVQTPTHIRSLHDHSVNSRSRPVSDAESESESAVRIPPKAMIR